MYTVYILLLYIDNIYCIYCTQYVMESQLEMIAEDIEFDV